MELIKTVPETDGTVQGQVWSWISKSLGRSPAVFLKRAKRDWDHTSLYAIYRSVTTSSPESQSIPRWMEHSQVVHQTVGPTKTPISHPVAVKPLPGHGAAWDCGRLRERFSKVSVWLGLCFV